MLSRRILARMLSAVALAVGLAAAPPLAGPAAAVEVLHDGGFEQNSSGPGLTTNPWWEGFDSVYPQGPLCRTDNYCGDGGAATPRSGVGWVWLGDSETANQTGWVRQDFTIPSGHQAMLSYWYRFPVVSAPFDATLTVSVDATVVATHSEPDADQSEYVQHVVDVSAFADGGQHVLELAYAKPSNPSPFWTDLTIDDVSLEAVDLPPQTSITNTTVQEGVARSLTVPVGFSASEGGSTFTCSLDGAPYAACTSPAQLTVNPGPHLFRVVARDAAGNADATPAELDFTAYDCVTLKASVVMHRTKVRMLKQRLRVVRAELSEAWAAHDKEGADRLQAKVHRIEKRRKAERLELREARTAYAPCLFA